jgi:hypothetical protein
MTLTRYVVATPLGPIPLASDEALVSIVPSVLALPKVREPPLSILLRMAGAQTPDELGRNGPVVASAANIENADNPEVRRYEAKFGRDAFFTAEFLAGSFPQLEEGTVRYFAAYQSGDTDEHKQSSPGKIPNHIRDPEDPLAQKLTLETGRAWPWFGGTDTTVQFLSAACRVLERAPEVANQHVVFPTDHVQAGNLVKRQGSPLTIGRATVEAARWLLHELAHDAGQPLLWVPLNRRDSFTIWTDSPNAFHYRDGTLAAPPVAPVQLQAQVYDALRALSSLARRIPELFLSIDELNALAERVKRTLLDDFVASDDRGMFLVNGVARDKSGSLSPLAVRTVNIGLVLDSGVLEGEDLRWLREACVRQLFSPELLSPFGIAGRARDEIRFEKFDYHSQVWAFASFKSARGLARHGFGLLARELEARIMRQTQDALLPENVGAGPDRQLEYCPHILTVRRPAPDGRTTVTVKERTPAPFAAWTAGAVVAIDSPSNTSLNTSGCTELEEDILGGLAERAYQGSADLAWRPVTPETAARTASRCRPSPKAR